MDVPSVEFAQRRVRGNVHPQVVRKRSSESFLAGTQFFFVHVAANGVLMVDFYPH